MKKNFLKDEIVSSNGLKSLELWHDSNFDTGRERLIQNNLIFTGLFFSRIFFMLLLIFIFQMEFRCCFIRDIYCRYVFSHILH